jgi:hypothetical protein
MTGFMPGKVWQAEGDGRLEVLKLTRIRGRLLQDLEAAG